MKRVHRRLLSCLMIVAMTLTLLPAFPSTAVADTGENTDPILNSEGYYELSTPAHMMWFSNQVNNVPEQSGINGKLVSNITLPEGWTPIGTVANSSTQTAANPYSGIFDGNGKTITINKNSANSNFGLFGYVVGGTIKNLTTAGDIQSYVSKIAAIVANAKDATIMNCTNKANVSGGTNVGGIVAFAEGSSDDDSKKTIIKDCTNSGKISSTQSNSNKIGGIVGSIQGSNVTIEGCINTGQIENSGSMGNNNTGGIVGGVEANANANASIENCINNGKIIGKRHNVGGVVGSIEGAIAITNCTNKGNVEGYVHVGGIVGYNLSSGAIS